MRLIDADALHKEISGLAVMVTGVRFGKGLLLELMTDYRKNILKAMTNAPTIDAVPVVRCKDCKHNNESHALRQGGVWCDYWGTDPDNDDFCCKGERRSDD